MKVDEEGEVLNVRASMETASTSLELQDLMIEEIGLPEVNICSLVIVDRSHH